MKKYFVFHELIEFVAKHGVVTDADMNNYAGDIEITGKGSDGTHINIKVRIEEEEKNGN